MKILHGGRASGKTAYAILESAITGYPILVTSERSADELMRRAKEMGVDIPYPVYYTGTRQKVNEPLIVDNFDRVFEEYVQREFGTRVAVGTAGSPIRLIAYDSKITASDDEIVDFMRLRSTLFETHYMGRWGGESDDEV